jgi:isoleucyl-tRNA synthetase
MASVRELASLGHSARREAGIKVRQPLHRAVLLVPEDLRDAVAEIADVLADELNVEELEFAEDAGELVRVTVRPNFRTAGPEFGPRVQDLAKYFSSLDEQTTADVVTTLEEGIEVDVDPGNGELMRVGPDHVEIRREPAEGTAFAYEAPFGVSLDLDITPDLRREGLVREFVHQVQLVRRDLGLDVTDRISLAISGPEELLAAVREHEEYLAEELLATTVEFGVASEGSRTVSVDGSEANVSLAKV